MSRHSATLTFLILCLSSTVSVAADSMALARQFVDLLRYHEQYESNRDQCLANAKTIPPESLLVGTPDKFFGLRPETPQWKEVIRAYASYWENICSRPTKEEFHDSLAKAYARTMSAVQLKAAIKFYSSEIGQKLISAHKAASIEVGTVFSTAYAKQVPAAVVEFDRRLKSIAESAENDCKQ